MIERDIERRVMDAVSGLPGMDGAQILGAWQPGAAGELQNLENASAAKVYVRAGLRRFETFGFGKAEFPCSVAVIVRQESDPQGVLMAAMAERLTALFTDWHLCRDEAMHAALSTDHFSADGFTFTGGEAPQFNEQTSATHLSFDFTIKGIIH